MIDYEAALTVAATRSEDIFLECCDAGIRPDAFQDERASAIWQALQANAEDGSPHSTVELWMRVSEDHADIAENVREWLSGASVHVESTNGYPAWLKHVTEHWSTRRKREAVEKAWDIMQEDGSPDDIVTSLADTFADIDDSTQQEEQRLQAQRDAVATRIDAMISGEGGTVSTGIPELDNEFGKLKEYEYITLAARPGNGKSSLARQIMMRHIGAEKKPVMFLSLEMTTDEVVMCLGSTQSQISSFRIETDFPQNQDKLRAACSSIARAIGKFLIIRDDCDPLKDIQYAVDRAMRRHKPSLIILDYLQLIESTGKKNQNRQQEVAEISRTMKKIARRHRVPVICLAQLNREVEKENRRPRLSDLKESGSIEQDSDRVWFLHKEETATRNEWGRTPMELIQAKCRGGRTCSIPVQFENKITLFHF